MAKEQVVKLVKTKEADLLQVVQYLDLLDKKAGLKARRNVSSYIDEDEFDRLVTLGRIFFQDICLLLEKEKHCHCRILKIDCARTFIGTT